MKKTDTFQSRRQEADAAKIRRLEKFKASPAQDSPGALERAATRLAQSKDQAERNATRAEAAEATRQAEQKAAEQAKIVADQKLLVETEAAEASRKAKRDARYANRKSGKADT